MAIKTEKWLRTWLRIKTEAFARRTEQERMTVGALIGNLDEIYKQALKHLKEVNDGQIKKLRKNRRVTKEKVANNAKII